MPRRLGAVVRFHITFKDKKHRIFHFHTTTPLNALCVARGGCSNGSLASPIEVPVGRRGMNGLDCVTTRVARCSLVSLDDGGIIVPLSDEGGEFFIGRLNGGNIVFAFLLP